MQPTHQGTQQQQEEVVEEVVFYLVQESRGGLETRYLRDLRV